MSTAERYTRFHERAEALDDACLRAWGHPDDYAIRQEILSAMECDDGFRAEQASRLLRDQMKQVQGHSAGRSKDGRSDLDHREVCAHSLYDGIRSFRRSLVSLVRDLGVRRGEPDWAKVAAAGEKEPDKRSIANRPSR